MCGPPSACPPPRHSGPPRLAWHRWPVRIVSRLHVAGSVRQRRAKRKERRPNDAGFQTCWHHTQKHHLHLPTHPHSSLFSTHTTYTGGLGTTRRTHEKKKRLWSTQNRPLLPTIPPRVLRVRLGLRATDRRWDYVQLPTTQQRRPTCDVAKAERGDSPSSTAEHGVSRTKEPPRPR